MNFHLPQVYDQCPSTSSLICLDTSLIDIVECEVTSVAGRVGPSYYIQLSGPELVSGTVVHIGDGIFEAKYVGPIAGVYNLEVRPCGNYKAMILDMCLHTSQGAIHL